MSFLAAPLIGGLASAGASSLLGDLFGGSKSTSTQSFAPTGINAGGLSTSLSGGNIGVTANDNRMGLVKGLSDTYGDQAGFFAGQRGLVAPGMSALRDARLQEIENARTSAIGNLRDNMARRRVLGSSFGQDALARAENEFGQAKSQASAETFLQELELTNQLANQEFESRRGAFQTGLDELNLEADVATKLAAGATNQLGANARLEAQLNAQSNAGAGKFFGQIGSKVGDSVSKGISDYFAK